MHITPHTRNRPGTIVPLLAVTLIGLLALVAMAIDIGLVAIARNQCQNAADVAALSGVRALNGDAATNNNYSGVAPTAQAALTVNKVGGEPLTASMLTTEIGYYAYNSTLQRFDPNFSGSKPASESWSAVRTTLNVAQPTYFARVLGLNSMPVTATATAVHRPRDIALILDFSGSMQFASEVAYPPSGDIIGSLNPDPAFPKFGHWSSMSSVMQRTTDYADSGGEVHATNNLTMDTNHGSAIVRDFLTRDSSGALVNAFHSPTSPYDAMTWACPAPQDFDVQSSTTATYVGDKWPCQNVSFTGTYATTAWEFLQGSNPSYNSNHNKSTVAGPGGGQFDPVDPANPQTNEGYGPNFKGYSVGPGYYGKTFYVWPPDPRWHPTNAALQLDWRKKFFYKNGTTTRVDDNAVLWDTSSGHWKEGNQSGSYTINYDAILAWIASGPKVLPDNLRAGRVLYYSAIPTTIPSSGGTADQRFWRSYINYVIGVGDTNSRQRTLYGRHESEWGTARITSRSNLTGADGIGGNADDPYMNYSDNPIRPRAHFWFGPLSMLCFLSSNNSSTYSRNWLPGTSHEAQCWQLKAGVNSALSDIQKNHPNDWVSLMYFSALDNYNTARVPLGRDYVKMKNALFFPFNQLANLSDQEAEVRPYDSSFNSTASGNIPNADGGTSPQMGFMVAYNQFSTATGFNGRRGAAKVVIFETDGVPNTTSNGTFTLGSPAPYKSYYASLSTGSGLGNNNSTVTSQALGVVQQLVNLDTNSSSPGYGTARQPVRIHAIAFGQLFESTTTTKTQALDFLLQVQKKGNTSPASASSIESYKIITGDYNTRIENLRLAFERIMQSGVQVSLIK